MSTEPGSPHLDEEALILHYLGDDEGTLRKETRRHLAVCERCRDELEQIGDTLALVSAAEPPAPPEGFERVMWARVSGRLASSRPAGWRGWLTIPRIAMASAAMTLLLAAFVAGRFTGEPVSAPPAATLGTLSAETAIRLATEDHLDRAEVMLVEVLHADADRPVLQAERTRAADLVAASRLLRQSMAGTGDASMAAVLEELERVLVEFSNRADGWSAAELDAFKARLDEGGVLFRLRVVSAEMRRGQRRAPVT
jgi:hypothetical protein